MVNITSFDIISDSAELRKIVYQRIKEFDISHQDLSRCLQGNVENYLSGAKWTHEKILNLCKYLGIRLSVTIDLVDEREPIPTGK